MTLEQQDEIRKLALKDIMWMKVQEFNHFGNTRKEYLEVIQFAIDKVQDQWGLSLDGDDK